MDKELDIGFLTGLFPREAEGEIYEKSKGNVQSAANALQWNLVEGLDLNGQRPVKIFNSVYVGAYPWRYRDLFLKTYPFQHHPGAEDINAGFLNLLVYKHISKYRSLKPHLEAWALDGRDHKVLIGYALSLEFVACLSYIKRVNPNVRTCIVVPDLPEFMNTSEVQSFSYRVLKPMETAYIYKRLDQIDCFVLLTDAMKDFLQIKGEYVVVEGIATDSFVKTHGRKNPNHRTFLYTGTLDKRFGIMQLIEAFQRIPQPDYRLVLCGAGDAEERIREAMKIDARIDFKGLLKREEILRLQQEATVLVNPRQNREEFTKYSFPSKIMEYLSSGTPVIAYKLDGMPAEYDDHIYYVQDDDVDTLRDRMVQIGEKDQSELDRFGEKARDFVLQRKNKKEQTRKIIKLLQDCEGSGG